MKDKSSKRVVHIIGPTGCGKGTALDYLSSKYGFSTYVFSKVIKDATAKKGIGMTRDNLYKVYDELKEKFGNDIIARKGIEEAMQNETDKMAFEGARHPEEIAFIRGEFPNVAIIYIDSKLEIRKKRIADRKKAQDILPEDELDKVVLRDLLDCESCKILPNVKIIENNGTLDEFKQKLDTLLRKF